MTRDVIFLIHLFRLHRFSDGLSEHSNMVLVVSQHLSEVTHIHLPSHSTPLPHIAAIEFRVQIFETNRRVVSQGGRQGYHNTKSQTICVTPSKSVASIPSEENLL